MGLAEAARLASPSIQRLTGSMRELAREAEGAAGELGHGSNSASITYAGSAVDNWGAAEQVLLHATVRAIRHAVGPEQYGSFIGPAIDFVHAAAWYVLMALTARAIDTGARGAGLPTLDQQLAALRAQVAALPDSYRRAATGDWGPPGGRVPVVGGARGYGGYGGGGNLGDAWDRFINACLHPNNVLEGGDYV